MAAKNIVAKDWSSWLTSFDGRIWSAWPAGDKPTGYQVAPRLLALDTDSGSLTGGENNKGFTLEAYGYALGRSDQLGQATGARVFFRDPLGDNAWHEVDNYRALTLPNVFVTHQLMAILFQIGSLGGLMTAGRALDVKLTVNGVDTNILTAAFIVQPGRTWYVDNVAGNDATGKPDDITKPFQYLQNYGGANTAVAGSLWAATTAQGDAGLLPGDCIVVRANSGTPYVDQVGFDNRWARFQENRHNGSPATGAAGHGNIRITRYPGPILGNAPETPYYQDPSSGRGGIMGPISAHANAGALTSGQYVKLSGLKVFSAAASSATDGAPINLQQGADNWWVSNCEVSWPTLTGALAGGIPGQGDNVVLQFNYVHDVGCLQTSMTNHGIYVGSGNQSISGGFNGPCSHNWIIRWNRVEDITGGSGIQFNDTQGSGDKFTGHKVYGNWIKSAAKNGLTCASSVQSVDIYNNIFINCCGGPQNGGSFKISDNVASRAINFTHNTIVQTATTGAYPYLLVNDGGAITSGTVNINHNILCLMTGHNSFLDFNNFGAGDTAVTLDYNKYFDFGGVVLTAPSKDLHAGTAYSNPLFTSLSTFDLTLAAGSPCLGAVVAAEPVAIATDFYAIARPQTGTGVPSVTFNDIGATQGIGT